MSLSIEQHTRVQIGDPKDIHQNLKDNSTYFRQFYTNDQTILDIRHSVVLSQRFAWLPDNSNPHSVKPLLFSQRRH